MTATNPDALRMVAALRAAGVPSALYKQDGLFQTSEARAVRDLLAAIDDPDDRPRRAKATWITPFFSVPLEVLPELEELPSSNPLLERLTTWKDLADARRFETLFSRILDDSGIVLRELVLKGDERAARRTTSTCSSSCLKRPAARVGDWRTWSTRSTAISTRRASLPLRTATSSGWRPTVRRCRS